MTISLTVKNTSRADYGRTYEYKSMLDYLFDTDIEGRFESDSDLDNSWTEQEVIDFDNPIVNGVDVAQSMYSAILDTCYFVADKVA